MEVNITEKQSKKESEKKRNRATYITFRVTEQERDAIDRRMEQAGIKNRQAYLLRMAMDGQIVRIETEGVKEMVRLLSNATNNINQIAKRANTTGSIYSADFDELSGRYEEIWGQAKMILRKLTEM
jgi:uncharacterized protein (DUF1778 family)